MKKLVVNIFLLSLVAVAIQSCSEEIKPSTDGKDTAIIFATLNANESVHYIKINKAFFGGGNSIEIAQIPDSSYFSEVNANVKEYVNGVLTRIWQLDDTLIENKDPGAFYAPEQKVYFFKTGSSPLLAQSGVVYKLEALLDNKFTVTAETELVRDITISQPTDASSFVFAKSNVLADGYASTLISFNTGTSRKIELILDVEFEEYSANNLLYTKSVPWKISEIDADDIKSSMSSSANGQTFYELIKQNVTLDENIDKRVFKGIRIRINGASNDLQKYLLINKPSSSLAQNKPTYTNLNATNDMRVIGIFASRLDKERYKPKWTSQSGAYYRCIDDNSTKELCTGTITGGLLFCTDNPALVSKTYFCN